MREVMPLAARIERAKHNAEIRTVKNESKRAARMAFELSYLVQELVDMRNKNNGTLPDDVMDEVTKDVQYVYQTMNIGRIFR